MNSEINKKTPAFIYAKEFKLSKVLGNLQAYKLATGEVGQAEVDEAAKKHGNNLGAIYGSLITKATLNENKRKGDNSKTSGQKHKRKRSRKGNKKDIKVDVLAEYKKTKSGHSTVPTALDEPLPLPDCLLKDEENSESPDHEDSTSNSSDEEVDFFGLASSSPSRKTDFDSQRQDEQTTVQSKQNFPEPAAHHVKQQNTNELTTYSCWRCKRRGHLPEHCTLDIGSRGTQKNYSKNKASYDVNLQELYMHCRKLKNSKTRASCNECENSSNLAYCFECGLTLCDGRGHLIDHFLNFPTHTKVYSYKLQRLLKCSNSSCNVVDVTELRTCSQCLSKTFDKHYSLVNATWSGRGLRAIINSITCEEHYNWHRMNCYNSLEEILFSQEKLDRLKREHNGLLSEFFF